MSRLLVHVEGQTEEDFVNEVLGPHLWAYGYTQVSARLLGNARLRSRRAGIKAWPTVRKDILNHLREDAECLSSMMVDYYGLPQSGPRAWPGRAPAAKFAFPKKARSIENALLADVCTHMDVGFNPSRFIPYVMMHEFEALLFSDCDRFSRGIARPDLVSAFQEIRNAFGSPEEINDCTPPSKRSKKLMLEYQKPLLGTLAVLEIGLDAIRRECPHFQSWLTRLESWEVGA